MNRNTKCLLVLLTLIISFSFRSTAQCPVAPSSADNAICPGTGSLSAQSSDGGITDHIWFGPGGGQVATVQEGPPHQGASVYTSRIDITNHIPGVYTYQVLAVKNGCQGPRKTVTFTVLTTPAVSISTENGNPTAACLGTGFKLKGSGGTRHEWRLDMSSGSPIATTDDYVPTQSGKYYLTAINLCGSATKFIDVAIIPSTPSAPFFIQPQYSVCKGEASSTYTVSSQYASSYGWAISPTSAGTLNVSGSTATVNWNSTYTGAVEVIATAYGCSNIATPSKIVVNLLPGLAPPTVTNFEGCPGSATLSAQSNNSAVTGHRWYNAQGGSVGTESAGIVSPGVYASSIKITQYTPGTYNYYVSAVHGNSNCSAMYNESQRVPVTLKINEVGSVTITTVGDITKVCQGSNNVELIGMGGKNHIWTTPTRTVNNAKIVAIEPGTYTLRALNNCDEPITLTRTVSVIPNTPDTPTFTKKETNVCQGKVQSEYEIVSGNAYSYNWTISPTTAGNVTFSGSKATVTWNQNFIATATITATTFGCNGTPSSPGSVVVKVNDSSAPLPPSTNDAVGCTGGTYTLTAYSGNDLVTDIIWYTDSIGGSEQTPTREGRQSAGAVWASAMEGNFTTDKTYWVAAVKSVEGCGSILSSRKKVTFKLVPAPRVPVIASGLTLKIPTGQDVILAANGAGVNEEYRWFDSNNFQVFQGNNFFIEGLTSSKRYYVACYSVFAPACISTKVPVDITVYSPPVITMPLARKISLPKDSVVLNATSTGSITSYSWEKIGGSATLAGLATRSLKAQGMEPGIYLFRLIVTDNNGYTGTGEVQVTVVSEAENYNYIKETTLNKEGSKDPNNLSSLTVNEKSVNTTYFDGLGREIQNVNWQASPGTFDVIQPKFYDRFGRDSISYLPYTNAKNGYYKPTFKVDQIKFYAEASDKIVNDAYPFAIPVYEPSPLHRVVEQGAPGQVWQPGNKTSKVNYDINGDDVKLWFIDSISNLPRSLVNYSVGELSQLTTTDEKGALKKEYKDKEGRVVLKRIESGTNRWFETYYIYDAKGNLRFVLPPECVNQWPSTIADIKSHISKWGFRYNYDSRNRMIEKQVPGSGTVRMVYDVLDRVVLTQDSVQSVRNQWVYTKYDNYDRPIMQGMHVDGSGIAAIRTTIESQSKFHEDPSTTGHGYTQNNCYPTTASNNSVLTVTYYDDYRFVGQTWFEETAGRKYSYFTKKTGYDSAYNSRVKGQVTAQKIKTLRGNNWLNSVTYYDDKYRPIRVIAENQVGGADTLSTSYDFVGKVLSTKTEHSGIKAAIIVKRFEYDHAGRLLKLYNQVDTMPEVLLAENKYNELGQLVEKGIGVKNNVPVQSIDYRYNIRGWLSNINRSDLGSDSGAKNDDTNDLFGMELLYEQSTY